MDLLWTNVCEVYPILNQKVSCSNVSNIENTISELKNHGIEETIYELIFEEITNYLLHNTVPSFWSNFQGEPSFQKFCSAVSSLHQDYKNFHVILDRAKLLNSPDSSFVNQEKPSVRFDFNFKSALLSQLPINFSDYVQAFYEFSFRIFSGKYLEGDNEVALRMDCMMCSCCENDASECQCQEYIKMFHDANKSLLEMGILDRLCGVTITDMIEEQNKNSVKEICQGVLRTSNITTLENWLDNIVLKWLQKIYYNDFELESKNAEMQAIFNNFKVRLSYFMYEMYATVIIDQFFDIIIDFPDSIPAIDDLKICLEKIEMRQYLITTIKTTLETRILHPGVDTDDILTGYVAAIKAIRHLDKSGVILETIIEPVKEYLRSRQDTVRCVINSLIEDSHAGDLAEEFAKSEMLKEDTPKQENILDWETSWSPDPIDAKPQKTFSKSDRSADIISMVVDIYGSKKLFADVYQSLLAERLLQNMGLNMEKEVRNLELLKLRLGESELRNCEVMLKDISDSKRINSHIFCDQNYTENKTFEMSTLIVSSKFWPSFKNETMELPESIQKQLDNYRKSYESYKGNRTLNWCPMSGKVTLNIELGGKSLDFTVTPIQATIISHFSEKNEWTVSELADTMKIAPALVRQKVSFWRSQGLIKEISPDSYRLIEEAMDLKSEEQHAEDDDDGDNAMASASDQREEALQVFWSYIVGMLTNLDSLPLARIHQMLKMFASHGPGVEFSQTELKNFLQKKVQEQKLVLVAGVYQLPK